MLYINFSETYRSYGFHQAELSFDVYSGEELWGSFHDRGEAARAVDDHLTPTVVHTSPGGVQWRYQDRTYEGRGDSTRLDAHALDLLPEVSVSVDSITVDLWTKRDYFTTALLGQISSFTLSTPAIVVELKMSQYVWYLSERCILCGSTYNVKHPGSEHCDNWNCTGRVPVGRILIEACPALRPDDDVPTTLRPTLMEALSARSSSLSGFANALELSFWESDMADTVANLIRWATRAKYSLIVGDTEELEA